MATKLKPEEALRIRRLAENGESVKDLASMFQVGRETIRRVLRGETWERTTAVPVAINYRTPQMDAAAEASLTRLLEGNKDLLNAEPSDEELGAPTPLDKHNGQVLRANQTLDELTRVRAAELLGKTDGGSK